MQWLENSESHDSLQMYIDWRWSRERSILESFLQASLFGGSWSMFVFMALQALLHKCQTTGFAKATKTSRAAKLLLEGIKFEEKSNSESESTLFLQKLRSQNIIIQSKSNHLAPRCACMTWGKAIPIKFPVSHSKI